ncbi:MAG: lipoyl(octanoyl) transferase LipB [Gammaproteobacteria bacterium]
MLTVRRLGLQSYEPIWRAMQYIASHPEKERGDELWLLSHKPVYTLGQAGRREHLLNPGGIPVVQTDRGGQVTYHGPGQLVIYLLLNLRQKQLGVRDLVGLMETGIIDYLADQGIASEARSEAPGVYVEDAKIASLGLRIRKGRSYHGLSLNVDMDLEPFKGINPCGYKGLRVTQLADLVQDRDQLMQKSAVQLANKLAARLGYRQIERESSSSGIV